MKWDVYKAKSWMLKTGMDHIHDGLSFEGGELVYEAKWGTGCDTAEQFGNTLKRVCWWDNEDIRDAILEAMEGTNHD